MVWTIYWTPEMAQATRQQDLNDTVPCVFCQAAAACGFPHGFRWALSAHLNPCV